MFDRCGGVEHLDLTDCLVQRAEAELGAAVGVGGGLKGNVGLNPLDLVRRGAAASIGLTNRVFGMAESGIKAVRDWFGPRR